MLLHPGTKASRSELRMPSKRPIEVGLVTVPGLMSRLCQGPISLCQCAHRITKHQDLTKLRGAETHLPADAIDEGGGAESEGVTDAGNGALASVVARPGRQQVVRLATPRELRSLGEVASDDLCSLDGGASLGDPPFELRARARVAKGKQGRANLGEADLEQGGCGAGPEDDAKEVSGRSGVYEVG